MAKSIVKRPHNATANLADAIQSGEIQKSVGNLMQRIAEFEHRMIAQKILDKILTAGNLPQADRDQLFNEIVSSESQRVLRLIGGAADDLVKRAVTPMERLMADILVKSATTDPTSANGLTQEATHALSIASAGLARRIREDHEAGILDLNRMEMLIGGGLGMHSVAEAIVHAVAANFPKS